jgi:hypothetical protein
MVAAVAGRQRKRRSARELRGMTIGVTNLALRGQYCRPNDTLMYNRMPEWNGYDDVGSALTYPVFHSILRATIPARAQSSSTWLLDAHLRR